MGRRRFGMVRKLPSGRYQASYLGPDGFRRMAPVTFVRKVDAEQWLARTEVDLLGSTWRDPDAGLVPFGLYAERWVRERPGLRPRTVDLYGSLLRLHVLPTFEAVLICEISPASVRSWYAERVAAGVGRVTVAKAYRLLRSILATADEDELIRRNPCRIKGAGVEASAERPVASVEQVLAIAAAIQPRYRGLVLLATFASLRWGELLALRRQDVDLTRRTVRVEASVVEVGGKLIVGPPKTAAGKRTVAIPAAIVPELAWHLQRFAEAGRDGRVFVGPEGATPRRTNFNGIWRAAVTKSGVDVPGLRLHDLRHTGNTFAAATGASLRELMARMGHASSRAALIYQHATSERDRTIADALDRSIKATQETREEGDDDGDGALSPPA
jgi:integrase